MVGVSGDSNHACNLWILGLLCNNVCYKDSLLRYYRSIVIFRYFPREEGMRQAALDSHGNTMESG